MNLPRLSLRQRRRRLCGESMTKFITAAPIDMPNVRKLEVAPEGRELYVWLDDGRSGSVDMSEWTAYPADKWDAEGFDHWRVDAGMPCWGQDAHISSVLCSEELVEIPYRQWHSSFSAGSA